MIQVNNCYRYCFINIKYITKDEIKEKCLEVTILNEGKDGDTLCVKVRNDFLGEFVIGNCLYNIDPQYFSCSEICLNGCCSLSLDDDVCNFFVFLTINSDDSTKGTVLLRC